MDIFLSKNKPPSFSVIALIENTSVFFGHLEGDIRDRKRIKTKGLAEEDSLREKIEIKEKIKK